MIRAPRLPLLLILLSAGAGCSVFANKTPTPAARINEADLAQIPPSPGVRYYLILFGSHDVAHRPAHTHSWATLVRAVDQPGSDAASARGHAGRVEHRETVRARLRP